jgi:hypothetical protein
MYSFGSTAAFGVFCAFAPGFEYASNPFASQATLVNSMQHTLTVGLLDRTQFAILACCSSCRSGKLNRTLSPLPTRYGHVFEASCVHLRGRRTILIRAERGKCYLNISRFCDEIRVEPGTRAKRPGT